MAAYDYASQVRAEKGKAIIDMTTSLHSGIWAAAERVAPKGLPIWAQVSQIGYQQVMNNVVINEFDQNPTKYVVGEMAALILGGVTATLVSGAVMAGAASVGVGMIGKFAVEYAYVENWFGFRNWVDGFNTWAGNAADYAAKMPAQLKQFMNDFAESSMKAIKETWETFKNDVDKTVDDINNWIKDTWQKTLNYMGEKWAIVKNETGELLQDLVNSIDEMWDDIADLVNNITGDVAGAIKDMAAAVITLTPIALDLNGNGRIDTLSANTSTNKVFFDIDNDNFREKTSWIQGGDGWLVRDLNGDGQITNQRELFGDSDGKLAYQKLAELNTNNTGLSANSITNADAAWGNLRVWIDANFNGVSDGGELRTLDSLGITSLSLESSNGSKVGSFVMHNFNKNALNDNLVFDKRKMVG